MMKLVRTTVCILVFMGGCASGVTDEERWEFVQQKFFDEPEMTSGGWAYRKFKYLAPLLAAMPGVACLWDRLKKRKSAVLCGKSTKYEDLLVLLYGVLTAALPAAFVWGMQWWRKHENYEAFRNYVIYWDEYKEYTPDVFHEAFDSIFKKYQEHGEPEKYLKEVAWPLTDEIIMICMEHRK
jgi:hypothetical protein